MTGPVMHSLSRVKEWDMNPRDVYDADRQLMVNSLLEVGLQDAIHVWSRPDGDYLLKGHRRFGAMRHLQWSECMMMIHEFTDEADAYRYLLQDHGHTVALNAEEKITAIENGVRLGMTVNELAPAMGVSVDRAQLWFDLGAGLNHSARLALADGRLSVNVAEVLLCVEDKKQRGEAVQMVLHDMLGEPLAYKAAKDLIEAQFILPARYRREWLMRQVALKKKFKVSDGYHYVEYDETDSYVQGLSGQPWPEFQYGDGLIPRSPDGERWQERAQRLGVPVYVVPAPLHKDDYVLLVSEKMLRAAESVTVPAADSAGAADQGARPDDDAEEALSAAADDAADDEEGFTMAPDDDALGRSLKTFLGAIYEHLCSHPTDVMTSQPWELLHEYLSHVVTDVDAGAVQAWLGITTVDELRAWMANDVRQRAPLRLALMLLLCAEADASGAPEYNIKLMAKSLGLDVAELNRRAA
jgi:hypothetical protein